MSLASLCRWVVEKMWAFVRAALSSWILKPPCSLPSTPKPTHKRLPLPTPPTRGAIITTAASTPRTQRCLNSKPTLPRPPLRVVPRSSSIIKTQSVDHRRNSFPLPPTHRRCSSVALSPEQEALSPLRSALSRQEAASLTELLTHLNAANRTRLISRMIDNQGLTLMQYAANNSNGACLDVILKALTDEAEVIEAVNSTGATFSGYTPLHFAAMKGDPTAVAILLKYGADPNAVTKLDATPLHLACGRSDYSVAELLITAGADVDRSSKTGNTALLSAVHNQDFALAQLLVNAGANPRLSVMDGVSALSLALTAGAADIHALLERCARAHGHKRISSSTISTVAA